MIIACDNDSSLENGVDRSNRMRVNSSYFDIFWAIQEIRDRIPIELESQKIAGHQNSKKPKRQLTRP